ncbi:hypothetical protein NMS90_004741, partial [Vibrio alginolyticus]|nr:hypothetical protein [Vibrio alginolyticus]
FLVQTGFIRENPDQTGTVKRILSKDKVNLGTIHCDLVFGATLFSYFLTTHQNLALNGYEDKKYNDRVTISYSERTHLLKCLKARQDHRIKVVEQGIEKFVKYNNPDQKITVNNNTFSIFDSLKFDKKKRTITFKFSKEFINELSNRKNPLTFIQVADLKEVRSNKIAGFIYVLASSISGINKQKFLQQKYLEQIFAITKNADQILRSAFKTLEKQESVIAEKKTKRKGEKHNFVVKCKKFLIQKIKKATDRKLFDNNKSETTVKSKLEYQEESFLGAFSQNTSYLDFV